MKKTIIFLLLITIYFSCTKEKKEELSTKNPFIHAWSLNLVTGGFSTPEVYENDDVIFDFKEDNTISINFNIAMPSYSQLPFLKDTVVSYQLEFNKMQLGGVEYIYTINDEYLTLNNSSEDDGILLQFKK